jgi:microcystin-dependent protein
MSQPFIGEIRIFAGNFAPAGWAFCDGSLQPISENDTLFNLIGTTYGGDGQETFALPNLACRIPVHMGTGPGLSTYQIGELGGQENVTLNVNQIPIHNHAFLAAGGTGHVSQPEGALLAAHRDDKAFLASTTPTGTLAGTSVANAGSSQPHENMPPFLAICFIISLFGVFPSQT